jgi:Pectate lyase superfamily protein
VEADYPISLRALAQEHNAVAETVTTIDTELGTAPSGPYADVAARLNAPAFDVKVYGAAGDGTTNDVAAIQAAINAASTTGAGTVLLPPGTFAIASSITLKNKVALVVGAGATIKWIGTVGGPMFTGGSGAPLVRAGVIGGTLDPGTAEIVFDLHSPQGCEFSNLDIVSGNATNKVFKIVSDSATTTGGYQSLKVSVSNTFSRIRISGTAGTVFEFDGVTVASPVTMNNISDILALDVRVFGERYVRWADNNSHDGKIDYQLTANNAVGVILNDDTDPTANIGVYWNTWSDLAVDCFGSMSGRVSFKMNKSAGTLVHAFHAIPAGEGGAIVDNAGRADSYQIISRKLDGTIERYTKGAEELSNLAGYTSGHVLAWQLRSDTGNVYAAGPLRADGGYYGIADVKLLNSTRATGWTAATGTPTRSTFATSTVTLPVLAEHVKALLDDLIAHGIIGP